MLHLRKISTQMTGNDGCKLVAGEKALTRFMFLKHLHIHSTFVISRICSA